MSGIATAVVASAVIGGIASNKANKKASAAQSESSQLAREATEAAARQAREDVNRLIPQAQETANLGFQGALDVFGQSTPAQIDAFQQGNLGAQQQLLAGLPQIQNAILGGNVDLSGLQPFQAQQPDLSFLQQQTPMNIQSAMQPPDPIATAPPFLSNNGLQPAPHVPFNPLINTGRGGGSTNFKSQLR